MKPFVIQSFLTFYFMDRTPKGDHSLESCRAVRYSEVLFFFNFTQFLILENLSVLAFGAVKSEGVNN